LQAKLLRVLETSEVRRLGDNRVTRVEFRLVAATNRNLEVEVAEGRFRADLYYRLDGLRIDMPTLSARVEDVPDLVDHFLRLESARTGIVRRMTPAVVSKLCQRDWPGNVRELANEVARLCVLSSGDVDDPSLVRSPALPRADEPGSGRVRTMAEIERDAIERAMVEAGGDKRKAADLLGISRAKVYQRLKEWSEAAAGRDEDRA
ncbi:MAG: sigma 54-interacting transcriptional regulator, partial [Planctomycetota bacterium]